MRGWFLSLAMAVVAHATPVAAQTGPGLPIAKGLWIQATDRCATATSGNAYDGARWGQIYYYGPNGSMGPVGEFDTIVRTEPVAGGFTNMKLSEGGALGYFHVRSLGADRAVLRVGAPARDRVEVLDETLMRCDFAALSPKMQTAVRRFAPTLATSAPTPAAAAAPGGTGWKAQSFGGRQVALFVGGPGLVKALAVGCEADGRGFLYVGASTKSRTNRVTATFRDEDGSQPQIPLTYFPAQDLWAGTATSIILQMLLTGSSITVDMGAMGRQQISLQGSTKAIREAMSACLFDVAAVPPPVAPLGISPGHYVQEEHFCGDAIAVVFYDGRRYGVIDDGGVQPGIVGPIGRPSKNGKSWQMTDGSTIEPLGPGRIVWSYEEGSTYRLCPVAMIEPHKRVR